MTNTVQTNKRPVQKNINLKTLNILLIGLGDLIINRQSLLLFEYIYLYIRAYNPSHYYS
jgi:hypothetical protein